MGIVNGSLELGYKNTAWFTANPTLVLKEGQIVYLEQTGTYKIGDGVSTLSALSFLGISSETQTLQNVTDLGSTTTNSITANGFVKTGGTASQFLKANGSVDSTTYLSTQVVPVGGTTGQILAKVDDTDYNLEWIENYANYTSVLKHTVKASVALTKGQAVYVSGASGTNMLVSKASNVSEPTSSKTLGLIAQDLAINGQGFVITEGLLSNLNTNSATIGDPVWLGVNGALIYGLVNKPYAPAHLVFIGIVTRVSSTVGEIFVKVQNGFELNEIHDVDLKTNLPNNNEILTFESSTSLWKPKTVVSALGFTPYNATNPDGYISGITSGMVTTALGFTPYDSANPSGYITSSALSSYVPYTGATANLNLGTRELSTPKINGSKMYLLGTDNALDGIFLVNATYVNVPNLGVTQETVSLNARGFTLTNNSTILTGGYVPSFGMGLAVNRTGSVVSLKNTNASGYSLLIESGNVGILTSNPYTPLQVAGNITTTWGDFSIGTFYQSGTDYRMGFNTITSQRQTNIHAYSIDTGGYITFSTGTNASPFVNARINPKQTSGSLSNFIFTKPDNTGQTASTSIAGLNYVGGSRQWATGAITTQSENVWGATTYSFVGASTITNAYGNVFNAPIAGTNCTITNNWAAQFNGNVVIGSTGQLIEIKQTTNTPTYTQTGATNSTFSLKSGTRTLEFVSVAGDQNYFSSTGANFRIRTTDANNVQIFTNGIVRWTFGFDGNFYVVDSSNFIFGTTNGNKLGTSTTQKIGFWNATPIVRPTTSVTASTFVTNTSGILNDTATFDGYTIGQVVKALRNMGLLA